MKKPGAIILFVALGSLFLALLFPRLMQVKQLSDRSAKLESALKKAKAENAALEHELRLMQSDPVYIEKVAREKFNKAKSGEIVYKVVRDSQTK